MQTICKKSAFRDEIAADLFIASLHKKTKVRARMPSRSYYCDKCGFWHITSKRDEKLERLQVIIDAQDQEIRELKQQLLTLQQATNKEDRVAVKADLRVKELSDQVGKLQKTNSRLHQDISSLVSKLTTQNQIKDVEQ